MSTIVRKLGIKLGCFIDKQEKLQFHGLDNKVHVGTAVGKLFVLNKHVFLGGKVSPKELNKYI
jgi:hypothetical protein